MMVMSKPIRDAQGFTAGDASSGGKQQRRGGGKVLGLLSLLALSGFLAICAYSDELGNSVNDYQGGWNYYGRRLLTSENGAKMSDEEMDGRLMAMIKDTWQECVDQHMNGFQCKNFIDDEIMSLFTGIDRMTRTVVKGKRSIMDFFYNSVVIYMDDDDIAKGRDGDGIIYYDFSWLGSGIEATPDQQSEIPPIICTETDPGGENPFTCEEEPVLVEGCTLEGALEGTDTNPCAGGVVIDPNTRNRPPEEDETCVALPWEERLKLAKDVPVVAAGPRDLPAFDCSCLSGYNCCLLIKETVKDCDMYGKAIQCHLNYSTNSTKHHLFQEGRGKIVQIYTNHNFVVSKAPYVEGSWPEDVVVE